jgi:hypothetical protein
MGAQKVHLSAELASNEAAGVKMSTPSDVGDIAFSTNCLARVFCSDVLQKWGSDGSHASLSAWYYGGVCERRSSRPCGTWLWFHVSSSSQTQHTASKEKPTRRKALGGVQSFVAQSRFGLNPHYSLTAASNVFVHHPVGGCGWHGCRGDGVAVLADVVVEGVEMHESSSEEVDVPAVRLGRLSPSGRPVLGSRCCVLRCVDRVWQMRLPVRCVPLVRFCRCGEHNPPNLPAGHN